MAATPLPSDVVALQLMVETLTANVQALERKLHDLHSTDMVSLRRAHASMLQHVEALSLEADGTWLRCAWSKT